MKAQSGAGRVDAPPFPAGQSFSAPRRRVAWPWSVVSFGPAKTIIRVTFDRCGLMSLSAFFVFPLSTFYGRGEHTQQNTHERREVCADLSAGPPPVLLPRIYFQ